jgi:N4-gp56 family major capsid protein
MATQTTLLGGLSPELRTFYDRNLLSRLLPRLVWALWGQPKPMPARSGQKVNYRRFASLAAATTPLTEGVTPGGSGITINELDATPLQFGDFVEVSDYLDFTAPDPVFLETTDLLGEQAADTIDQLTRDVLLAGTTVQYANGRVSRVTVAAGDILNDIEIYKAVRTMQTNKVKPINNILNASTGVGTQPIAGGFVAIISPAVLYSLKTQVNTKFVPVHEYGSRDGLLPHEVGALDEVRFVLSNNPKVFPAAGAGSPGIDVHCTLIIGADFYGLIMPQGVTTMVKPFGSGGTTDPLDQRQTVGWKMLYTAVILQQLAGIRVEHAIS